MYYLYTSNKKTVLTHNFLYFMETTLDIQKVVNNIEDVFVMDEINAALRYKHQIIFFIRSVVGTEFANEANKRVLESEGYKNAMEKQIKKT